MLLLQLSLKKTSHLTAKLKKEMLPSSAKGTKLMF